MEAPRTATAPTIFDVLSDRAPAGWPFGVQPEPEPELEPEPVVVEPVIAEPVVLEPLAPPAAPEPSGPRRREVRAVAAERRSARRAEERAAREAAREAARQELPAAVEVEPEVEPEPESEPGTTRTLERRTTSRRGQAHPKQVLAGQAISAVCMLAAVVLVVAALLLVAQANEDNGLVVFVNDLAGHLDLGVFDVDNGVMKFEGVRSDLKNALFNRGVAALVWVFVGRVAERLLGSRR